MITIKRPRLMAAATAGILATALSIPAHADLPEYSFVRDLNNRGLLEITASGLTRSPTDITNDGIVMAMSITDPTSVQPRLWLYNAAADTSVAAGIQGLMPGFSLLQQNNMAADNHYLVGQPGSTDDEFHRCRIDTITINPVTGAPAALQCQTIGRLQITSPPWAQAQMNDTGWAVHYEADNPLTVISEITITDPNGISQSLDISDLPTGDSTRYASPVVSNGETPDVVLSFITDFGEPTESTTLRIYSYDGTSWVAQDYSVPPQMFAEGANDGRILMRKRQLIGNDYSIYTCQPSVDSCAAPTLVIDGTSDTYQTIGGLTTNGVFYYGLQQIQNNTAVFVTHMLYDLGSGQSMDLQDLLNSVPGYESATLQGMVISPDATELLLGDSTGNLLYFSADPATNDAGFDVTLTFYPPGQTRSYTNDLTANAQIDNGIGPFEYRFIIQERIQGTNNPQVFNSNWQASPSLVISPTSLGLEQGKDYLVIVRARDTANGNEKVVSQKRLNLR